MIKNFKKFNLIFLFFLTALSPFSYSSIIEKIEINGIVSLSRGTILSYLPIEVGDEFNEEISDLTIAKLYKTGLFEDIQVIFIDNTLQLKISESPVIKYFEVKGFKNDRVLNEDALNLSIKDAKLSAGNLFKKDTFDFFIKKLNEEYLASGHYKANINPKIEKDSSNRIGIEINIDEGDVARINSFRILGSKDFDEDELLDFFNIMYPNCGIKKKKKLKKHGKTLYIELGNHDAKKKK